MRACCTAQGTLLKALWWPKWEGNENQRGVCIHIVDSHCHTVETNNIVDQLYSNESTYIQYKNISEL